MPVLNMAQNMVGSKYAMPLCFFEDPIKFLLQVSHEADGKPLILHRPNYSDALSCWFQVVLTGTPLTLRQRSAV